MKKYPKNPPNKESDVIIQKVSQMYVKSARENEKKKMDDLFIQHFWPLCKRLICRVQGERYRKWREFLIYIWQILFANALSLNLLLEVISSEKSWPKFDEQYRNLTSNDFGNFER